MGDSFAVGGDTSTDPTSGNGPRAMQGEWGDGLGVGYKREVGWVGVGAGRGGASRFNIFRNTQRWHLNLPTGYLTPQGRDGTRTGTAYPPAPA